MGGCLKLGQREGMEPGEDSGRFASLHEWFYRFLHTLHGQGVALGGQGVLASLQLTVGSECSDVMGVGSDGGRDSAGSVARVGRACQSGVGMG